MARQEGAGRRNRAGEPPAGPGPREETVRGKAATAGSPGPASEPATETPHAPGDADATGAGAPNLADNVARIEALGARLVAALARRQPPDPAVEGPGPDLMRTAASAWMQTLAEQPGRVLEHQVRFWGETIRNYADAQAAAMRGQHPPSGDEPANDPRFANPLWHSHPFFSLVRRQYLTNARALRDAARDLHLSDDIARRRIAWLTEQIVDMTAPTNFLATNPDALERAVETEGESLVRGLENLVRDVEANDGEVIVSLADRDAFTVGRNLGTTQGRVVHRTHLFELIQYSPLTEQVHDLPLLILPPWINKFYILDLKPQNSLVRWLVEQGHTLFIVSWKNPDAGYAETGLEDYVSAYLQAMDRVRELTDRRRLNVAGYCIGGTTLALTLALLAQRGDDRVNAATLLTTLTDFSDQGDFVNVLQDDLVDGIAAEVARHGVMPARLMARTMSFLRPRDLVWGPAIRSYLMGESPPAFDLLFWNGDGTNLPGRMVMQYLRGLCQQNRFATDGFDLLGHRLTLSQITQPLCAVACEKDHIAPWKDCFTGFAAMGARDRTFLLSESGHVAGIVNAPTRRKYGFFRGGTDFGSGYAAWKDAARFVGESWWPEWGAWLAQRAGPMQPARHPGEGLGPAPGGYVLEAPR